MGLTHIRGVSYYVSCVDRAVTSNVGTPTDLQRSLLLWGIQTKKSKVMYNAMQRYKLMQICYG